MRTFFWYAVSSGNLDLVKKTHEKNPEDLEKPDDEDNTPLHVAVRWEGKDYSQIIDFLLDKGHRINFKNKQGETPFNIAIKNEVLLKKLGKALLQEFHQYVHQYIKDKALFDEKIKWYLKTISSQTMPIENNEFVESFFKLIWNDKKYLQKCEVEIKEAITGITNSIDQEKAKLLFNNAYKDSLSEIIQKQENLINQLRAQNEELKKKNEELEEICTTSGINQLLTILENKLDQKISRIGILHNNITQLNQKNSELKNSNNILITDNQRLAEEKALLEKYNQGLIKKIAELAKRLSQQEIEFEKKYLEQSEKYHQEISGSTNRNTHLSRG